MQNIRKVTSLTALWAFGLLILTSIVLYIVPAGRVAYWADWRLLGLTKTQWGALHINLGVLFLIAGALHIYLNWKSILAYMKTRAKQVRIFTRDFNIAMALSMIVIAGTWAELPPFSTVIAIGNSIKDAGAVKYGEPPYGHAELSSLKTFAGRMGWDVGESLVRLRQKGFTVADDQQTLNEVALLHNVTPQQVYLAMQPPAVKWETRLPDTASPGLGRRTLADLGQAYQFSVADLIAALKGENINAKPEMTIKDLAELHRIAPQELYALIKRLTDNRS